VGEIFPFEVQLMNGEVALAGEGKVIWVKPFDPARPNTPHGMGVQFVRIAPWSRETLNRILRSKQATPARSFAGPPGAVRGPSQSLVPTAAAPRKESGNGIRIDTNVDLAAEFGIDDAALRRATERSWMTGPRSDEELDALLRADPVEPATLEQALSELPRLLDPAARRRTGSVRPLESGPFAPSRTPPPVISRPQQADDEGRREGRAQNQSDAEDDDDATQHPGTNGSRS
jgi:hypothetical protein